MRLFRSFTVLSTHRFVPSGHDVDARAGAWAGPARAPQTAIKARVSSVRAFMHGSFTPRGVIETAHDVTEQGESGERCRGMPSLPAPAVPGASPEASSALLDSLAEIVFHTDGEGRWTYL